MKILVIHGSIRKGNTYKLTMEVISELKSRKDVEIKEISVAELNLPFCVSCHSCFVKGEQSCPHYSIVSKVAQQLVENDGIIMTGVVYSMHLNAAMKNLIDHLSYLFHRPRLFDKKGLVVTTTAGAAEKTVANYLKSAMAVWGINNIKTVSEKIQVAPFSLTAKQKARVSKTANEFYDAILKNKYAEPSFDTISVFNAFRGMVSSDTPISEYDKTYWNNTGLINTTYPIKTSLIKRLYGALTFNVLRTVMNKNGKDAKH